MGFVTVSNASEILLVSSISHGSGTHASVVSSLAAFAFHSFDYAYEDSAYYAYSCSYYDLSSCYPSNMGYLRVLSVCDGTFTSRWVHSAQEQEEILSRNDHASQRWVFVN